MVYNPANEFVMYNYGGSFSLDDPNHLIDIRFTAQESTTIAKLHIFLNAVQGSPPTYQCGIQGDINGNPDGSYLGSTFFTPTEEGWNILTLSPSIALTKGHVYHIVIKYDSGVISGLNYITIRSGMPENVRIPLNKTDLNINSEDTHLMMQYSRNNGDTWIEDTYKTPVFLLEYSDGLYGGQPYQRAYWWEIYGSVYIGEKITISNVSKTVTTVGFWVYKKGDPIGDLEYEIRNSVNTILRTGTLATASEIQTIPKWFDAYLSSDLILIKDNIYLLVLKAPDADSTNHYKLCAGRCEYLYQSNKYGQSYSNVIRSTHNGESWSNIETDDVSFRLSLGAPCPNPIASFIHSGEACI